MIIILYNFLLNQIRKGRPATKYIILLYLYLPMQLPLSVFFVPLYVFELFSSVFSHPGNVMFQILQTQLQQYLNRELPDVQAEFQRGRGTRDQIANIQWIMEKAKEFQKNIYVCFTGYTKALSVQITANCGKFLKRWEYQTTLTLF